jgi:diguanylate cyclase (GGDEF)-like protein
MTASTPIETTRRLPRWAVHGLLVSCTLGVASITLVSGELVSPFPVLYFWVATCAFCFLSRREAMAHAACVAVAYAAGLLVAHGASATSIARFSIFALALAVGGGFIAALRARHDQVMAELRTVSKVDSVSGLLDRRGFDEAMANELERARRSGSRFGLIVGSVDSYDDIPPAARGAVLAAVGACIARAKREIDAAARLEGEEFAILATYTDERGAQVLADRICASVRDAGALPGTMSLGVVSHPRHGASADVLLNAAREARNEAVGLGGDRSLQAVSAADWISARLDGADVQVVPQP